VAGMMSMRHDGLINAHDLDKASYEQQVPWHQTTADAIPMTRPVFCATERIA